jgi:hypothetical protein
MSGPCQSRSINDTWHAKPRERVSVPVDEDKDVIDEEDEDEEDA